MRILHISDLHFGNHDESLKKALVDRVHAPDIKPDLIVCTGDVANEPHISLLEKGFEYLQELANCCSNPSNLIVVPGNHDYRASGFLMRSDKFKKIFPIALQDRFVETDAGDVWVFGFNSAAFGQVGGNGLVHEKEITRFHNTYEQLMSRNPRFSKAFKIVAVHHHPLPVSDKHGPRAPWLTMINAGQFLTAVLLRKIDLVLHGHEHLQAQAEFWSTLGNNEHKVHVISLGATLKKNEAKNWFGLVCLDNKEVRADFYPSVGQTWALEPTPPSHIIYSSEKLKQTSWQERIQKEGYFYRELASLTVLDEDGDAERTVECGDLTILQKKSERSRIHQLRLPASSGLLDCLKVEASTENIEIEVAGVKPAKHHAPWDVKLKFTPELTKVASYRYRWYAVNAFAMNQEQFGYLYGRDSKRTNNTEFTHYVVQEPIEDMTIAVQFPPKFKPVSAPKVRVTLPPKAGEPDEPDSRKWGFCTTVQNKLEEEHALRFYPAMNIAALRVKQPELNLSYGIQWRVPEVTSPERDPLEIELIESLGDKWKNISYKDEGILLKTMLRIIVASREAFLREANWNGPLSASIMYFDRKESKLRIIVAASHARPGADVEGHRFGVTLRYGDGVAGRAFKANRSRVYVAADKNLGQEEGPDYFLHIPGQPDFKIVVALPLHVPVDDGLFRKRPRIYETQRPYGVLNLDSERGDCPLALLRNIEKIPHILQFQHMANQVFFESLLRVFSPDRVPTNVLTT
jgi:3',5'-cyclic AMP phosphodiesterase CpdA